MVATGVQSTTTPQLARAVPGASSASSTTRSRRACSRTAARGSTATIRIADRRPPERPWTARLP